MDKVIAKRTHEVRRTTPSKYDWDRAVFTAQLEHLKGNACPHFSITGETFVRERWDSCGCIHDTISEYWSEVRPFILLRLADDTGVPMHAVANAAHWAREYFRLDLPGYKVSLGSPDSKPCVREILRDHLRISDSEVDALLADCERASEGFGFHPQCWKSFAGDEKVSAIVATKVETLRERWANEATAFLAWLKEGN